ncbi:PQQ-binding-like beta-propeller repeat protein [Micromonospora sp. NPDC126480]|uniref:outer membrane protein assembly factor BamB family protein n=1 Tax=Micromonospora sp. NPDC126480 TaxID=3155312 RepID=UPI00332F6641
MTVIDLGELRPAYQPVPPVRPRRKAPRLPLLAVVLLVALVTSAASAPVPARDAAVVPAPLGADWIVGDGSLFIVHPPERIGADRSVTAHRLPSGAEVWRAPLPVSGEFRGLVVGPDLLFLSGNDLRSRDSLTVALDMATGARRWQQPGAALLVAGGNVVLREVADDETVTLRAVEACCGTLRWQEYVPSQAFGYHFTDVGADRVVLTYPSGRIEVRDAGTGVEVASADLPGIAGRPADVAQVVGDLLLIADGTRVTGYGVDRLDRRWQAAVPGGMYAGRCGGQLCFRSPAGSLQALDAATGRPLWSLDGRNDPWELSGRLVLARLSVTGTGRPDLAVLDPATGAVRAELGRWWLARSPRPDDPLIGVRAHPDGGLLVAELDTAVGAVRPLDVLPDAAADCEVADGCLLCRRNDGSLGLWSLRR